MTDRTELEAAVRRFQMEGGLVASRAADVDLGTELSRILAAARAHLACLEITDAKVEAAKSAMENLERRIVESDDEFAWRKARAALVAARQTSEKAQND